MVSFDAEVAATAILNDDEAVTGTRKGELIVWNLLTGQPVRQMAIAATLENDLQASRLPPHNSTIHTIAVSEDQQYMVTGAQDSLVRVWALPQERLLHTLEGHTDDVSSALLCLRLLPLKKNKCLFSIFA